MRRYLFILPLLILVSSCSTQKNTAVNRAFHQMKVRYNIYFNGNQAFLEGQQAIISANQDDYTQILNLYPVSNHKAAESSTSQMDQMIEKCRKCIKLHSIKAKPKPNLKKKNDPKYKLWLQQEEFNAEMDNVWIRLGESEFSKGDFLGSIGTFTYVQRHYSNDPDVVARCQLWIARAYGELGWYYEADDILHKIKVDDLKRKHQAQYAATNADILIKTEHYHEAIPFVKLAIPSETRKLYKPRFQYILGQLYEREGKNSEAIDAYRKVVRLAPPAEMEFNARLRQALLRGKSSIRSLKGMTRQSKNKNNLDQIYTAIGDIYLAAKDTTQALEYYQQAIEESTQAGNAKAAVLVKAGDIYFDTQRYTEAQPCYKEASGILSSEHRDYARVIKRADILDELTKYYNTVVLQDSLQRISHYTAEEQLAIANKIIEDLIKAEEEEEEARKLAEREEENELGPLGVNTRNMLGGGGSMSGEWYFYNEQLKKSGAQEFKKQWGNRPLEDNWRRLSKTVTASTFTYQEEGQEGTETAEGGSNDSTQNTTPQVQETDTHNPNYYLQQIPRTAEDYALSDSMIAEALYNLVYIYRDKVEDINLANETLAELARRFPKDERIKEIYFQRYLSALRDADMATANECKNYILRHYPDSKQAEIVSQPDYIQRMRRMEQEQDSLYQATYNAYTQNDFKTVKANKQYAEQKYPLSPLIPRFLFLNAVATARSEGQEPFTTALKDMVERYPNNELSAMAKDMLAMLAQGMESQTGSNSTLATLRGQAEQQEEAESSNKDKEFSTEREEQAYVLFILPKADEKELNKLLYNVALFNFSQFLIKDFELRAMPVFATTAALRMMGLESLDEALWWVGMAERNTELKETLRSMNIDIVCITESNYQLINKEYTIEDYKEFAKKTGLTEKIKQRSK